VRHPERLQFRSLQPSSTEWINWLNGFIVKDTFSIFSMPVDNFSPDFLSLGLLTQQVGASSEPRHLPASTPTTEYGAKKNIIPPGSLVREFQPRFILIRARSVRECKHSTREAERIIKVWCMCGLFNEIREKVHLESRRHYTQRTQHVEPSSGHGLSG